MAIKKIPCGGWLYDDEQITFEDGVMKVIGGGSGGATFVNFEWDGESTTVTADKTPTEALNLMASGALIIGMLTLGEQTLPIGYALMDLNYGFPAFMMAIIDSETAMPIYAINSNDDGDEWVCHLEIM